MLSLDGYVYQPFFTLTLQRSIVFVAVKIRVNDINPAPITDRFCRSDFAGLLFRKGIKAPFIQSGWSTMMVSKLNRKIVFLLFLVCPESSLMFLANHSLADGLQGMVDVTLV